MWRFPVASAASNGVQVVDGGMVVPDSDEMTMKMWIYLLLKSQDAWEIDAFGTTSNDILV